MNIHEQDLEMRPDSDFISGSLEYLVVGNSCRLLDGRRTPGFIEEYFPESEMFRWQITKFEDKGKHWDLPVEDIVQFQFELNSQRLSAEEVTRMRRNITQFQEVITVKANDAEKVKTEQIIEETKNQIITLLTNNPEFIKEVNLKSNEGSKCLSELLKEYLKSNNLLEVEEKTAELLVVNPNSGDWVKGLSIVLAEMGLKDYHGKVPRTKTIFDGIGSKENRRQYIIHRLAFIRAFFCILNIHEVVLYRGMSSERDFSDISRTFLSCTFDVEVGKAFSNFDASSKYRASYLIKITVPIEKLFMTFLETDEMNRQYKEAEAILIYDPIIQL